MKWNRNSFGAKLWRWFLLFTVLIFASLWLLQTVFLQSCYDSMAIRRVKQTAASIQSQQDSPQLERILSQAALTSSALIFLTDWEGGILFSADEHSALYAPRRSQSSSGGGDNPYWPQNQQMSWQEGAFRNLPAGYLDFLQLLSSSQEGSVGYKTEQGDSYIYGLTLTSARWGGQGAVLYISMPLGAVGAAASILRVQLLWVTLASLALSFFLSYLIARQFAKPVSDLSRQAGQLAQGKFSGSYQRGFCQELDELSDTMQAACAELERLENARRELLANVSHDLRTPLTMIKGYAELVQEISWSDEARRSEDLSVIIREADRLTGLVNDILDCSAAQSHRLPCQNRVFDLSALVLRAAQPFAPLCRQQGCRITLRVEPEQWVLGDPELLERVLYNLIDNALCHSGSRQTVFISLAGRAGWVRAQVQDQGEGIPAGELPYIWDRYFTAKQRGGRGTASGLGLAIVKEILQAQRAQFGVDSQPGQGCAFWFALKREPPPEPSG